MYRIDKIKTFIKLSQTEKKFDCCNLQEILYNVCIGNPQVCEIFNGGHYEGRNQ